MAEKKSFLTNLFKKFARKIPCNIGISSSICFCSTYCQH